MDDVLRRAPLFAALDDEQAAELRASMSEVTLARGDALFHEGDQGDRLYVVTEGKVKLHRTSPDGRENMLAVLGPGSFPSSSPPLAPLRLPVLLPPPSPAAPGPGAPPSARVPALAPLSACLLRCPPCRPRPAGLDRFGVQSKHPRRAARPHPGGAGPARRPPARRSARRWRTSRAAGWLRLETRAVILLDVERLAKRSR
ncbi:Crp/Fnr family transcriptional regulator [Streptomyces californicus]